MSHKENEQRSDWAEIVSRRRALKANCGIYARRHGPGLLAVLSGSAGIRARYIGQLSWFELEDGWRETDARRIGELAAEIVRFGRDRGP